MRNIDIETFFVRIKQSIEIASSYIKNKRLKKLIISCRLKPKSIFTNSFIPNKLELVWCDEFDNELVLEKNAPSIKRVVEKTKTPSIKVLTDLFGLRSLSDTMRDSRVVAITNSVILLIGKDEYFRAWSIDGKRISPLELGIDNLLRLIENSGEREKDFDGEMIMYRLPNVEVENMLNKEYKE